MRVMVFRTVIIEPSTDLRDVASKRHQNTAERAEQRGEQEQDDDADLGNPKGNAPLRLRLFFLHSSQYSKQTQQVSGNLHVKVD
jgi:hypothetical protein